jgi:hypothetical protein
MSKIVLLWLMIGDLLAAAAEALPVEGSPNPTVGGLEQLKYPVRIEGFPSVSTDWIPATSKRICTESIGLLYNFRISTQRRVENAKRNGEDMRNTNPKMMVVPLSVTIQASFSITFPS